MLSREGTSVDSSHDRPINYFQIDQQLGAVLWEIGRLSGCPLSRQSLKGIADTYSAIGRIWRSGQEPYELRGKEGLWKMMDQETIASSLLCSRETINRRMRWMKNVGLIRFEKYQWVAKKYLQFNDPLIVLATLRKQPNCESDVTVDCDGESGGSKELATMFHGGTQSSLSKMSESHAELCQEVTVEDGEDSRLITRELTRQSTKKILPDLSSSLCSEPRSRMVLTQAVHAVVQEYDKWQQVYGGRASEAQTLQALLGLAIKLSEEDALYRIGRGLGRANALSWYYCRAHPHSASLQLSQALRGEFLEEPEPDSIPPDASWLFHWDHEKLRWLDDLDFAITDHSEVL